MNPYEIIKNEIDELAKLNLNTYSYAYEGKLSMFKIFQYDEINLRKVVDKSENAFLNFSMTSVFERTNILLKAALLLEEFQNQFAEIISIEAKKPLKFSRQEVSRSIQTLKLSAIEASNIHGEQINLDIAENGMHREAFTKFEPLGVIYAMTPFNFPLNLALHKIGPALAIGNSVILKPSEKTPFSAYLLKHLLDLAGLPEDVLQIITGDGATITDQLLKYNEIKKVSFTGSPNVGKLIKSKVGLRALTLELGSTAPVYISDEIDDLEIIVNQVVNGSFSYNGQACISVQKVYVAERHFLRFLELIKEKSEALKYGDILDENTDYTDLIDINSQKRIMNWINQAVQEGATVITGGTKKKGGITPTVITNAPNHLNICAKEIFGPVVVVENINHKTNIIEKLNKNDFGLNVGIFTNNIKNALKLANELEYGQVLINDIPTLRFDHMPYNGRKESGYGTEGIKFAIKEMSKLKMVSINYG